MSTRGIWKMHGAAQTQAAWDDFRALAQKAVDAGRKDLAEKHCPPLDAGWRTIDKAIANLREALGKPCPHCDNTGRINHGWMREYFCGCAAGKKLLEDA